MIRLGILGSNRGTHLPVLVDAISEKRLCASIEIVMSNKSSSLILERALHYGLKAEWIDTVRFSREKVDQQIAHFLQQYQVDLLILMGYMRILSSEFVIHWKNKIINIHPSLLPAFAGKMDLAVHQAVLDAGVTETGCTVHYVTEEVDAGPILVQKKCIVKASDNAKDLKARVQELEGQALIEAIGMIAER